MKDKTDFSLALFGENKSSVGLRLVLLHTRKAKKAFFIHFVSNLLLLLESSIYQWPCIQQNSLHNSENQHPCTIIFENVC